MKVLYSHINTFTIGKRGELKWNCSTGQRLSLERPRHQFSSVLSDSWVFHSPKVFSPEYFFFWVILQKPHICQFWNAEVCIESIYHGAVKLVTKLVNFLKGENLLNFWRSFVASLKVLVFKTTGLVLYRKFFLASWFEYYTFVSSNKKLLWDLWGKAMIQTIPIQ